MKWDMIATSYCNEACKIAACRERRKRFDRIGGVDQHAGASVVPTGGRETGLGIISGGEWFRAI
jgi:hypothetical protein